VRNLAILPAGTVLDNRWGVSQRLAGESRNPKMKTLTPPAFSVILSTVLCVWLSRVFHLPSRELKIVAVVSFSVSAVAAFGAVALAGLKPRRQTLGSRSS